MKLLFGQGRQYIRDLDGVELPAVFRGLPVVSDGVDEDTARELAGMCPSGAIGCGPLSIDLGRCLFCNECAMRCPSAISFTSQYRMATNLMENLVISAGSPALMEFDERSVRREIRSLFGRSLRFRHICAGGDGSTDMELNASMNVNFDFGRYGVEFVASPRHADGVVITGPITSAMAISAELCFNAMPDPKMVILAGTDAISGGLFAGSPAVDRRFLERFGVDLYIPGNPVHPLTFIHGVLSLTGQKIKR